MAAVEGGETLLTAAERAGVYINSICGAELLCGKCRLILQRGRVDSQPTALLTRDEIRQGYVLACQTRVHKMWWWRYRPSHDWRDGLNS